MEPCQESQSSAASSCLRDGSEIWEPLLEGCTGHRFPFPALRTSALAGDPMDGIWRPGGPVKLCGTDSSKLLPFLHQAAFQFLAEAACGDALEHGPDLAVQMTRPGLCPKVGFGCRKLRGCPDVYRGSARLELLDSVGKCEWPRRAKS